MIYYLGELLLGKDLGPARLLQSYMVLISLALYCGFVCAFKLIPKFYEKLPHDRGREFTINAEAAKGKPTGAGVVFITMFAILCVVFVPLSWYQASLVVLTWLTMLTGFLDDKSISSWGEYRKGLLDLLLCGAASVVIYFFILQMNPDGKIIFWLPFISGTGDNNYGIVVHPVIFFVICIIMLWISINTTNCTDGVDGLSGTLTLIALITLGILFYFVFGHIKTSEYLHVPYIKDGASWAVMIFAMAGVLMGYLWHNAFPSKVLMGDAGSRALGFFIGIMVMLSCNPFLFLATSTIMFLNGGTGLLKVFLLRFFKIKIFSKVRFPLHDHMRKNRGWSPAQVLVKFMIMQILVTVAALGIMLKVRWYEREVPKLPDGENIELVQADDESVLNSENLESAAFENLAAGQE